MTKEITLPFEKYFQINKNFFMRFYLFLNNDRYPRIVRYFFRILFNRIAFSLLKNDIKLDVKASFKNKFFKIRSTNSQFHSIYFPQYTDGYEREVTETINKLLPNNGTFIDIGSNWGHHSISTAISKNAKVISFEPNPLVFNDLIRIVRDLGLKNIECINVALGNENKDLVLSQENFDSGTVSIDSNNRFLRFPEKIFQIITFQKPIKYSIKQKTLDSLIENINIDLIKIDVEGFELNCLTGGGNTIDKNSPDIIIEIFEETYYECQRFLGKFGYKFFQLKINNHGNLVIIPIVNPPKERLNALASKKELLELKLLINEEN